MRASRWVGLFAAVVSIPLLLFCAEPCAAGVHEGMVLCGGTLIPALFPFLVICELLSALLPCRSSKTAAVLTVLLSVAGGYPAGVRTAERLYQRGLLTPVQAKKLALCCCNAGPAFLVTAVGVKLMGDQSLGFFLLGNNLCAMLLTLLTVCLLRLPCGSDRLPCVKGGVEPRRDGGIVSAAPASQASHPSAAVGRAVNAMLGICGYTLLACCLLRLAKEWMGQGVAHSFLCGVLEITSGCRVFAHADRLPMLCAVCSFGGLCVLAQNLPSAARCGVRWYALLAVRMLNSLIAFLLALPFCKQPLLAVFSAADDITPSVSAGNASTAVAVFLLLCAFALLSVRLLSPGKRSSF